MQDGEMLAVYCESHSRHISSLCAHNERIFVSKFLVHTLTMRAESSKE